MARLISQDAARASLCAYCGEGIWKEQAEVWVDARQLERVHTDCYHEQVYGEGEEDGALPVRS